jgi:hypothetical protein
VGRNHLHYPLCYRRLEARVRIELTNQCFAGTSLNHLGSEPWWDDRREFNPSRAILRRSAPCLASHGTLDRIRTRDFLIRSQNLFPLSYEGMLGIKAVQSKTIRTFMCLSVMEYAGSHGIYDRIRTYITSLRRAGPYPVRPRRLGC